MKTAFLRAISLSLLCAALLTLGGCKLPFPPVAPTEPPTEPTEPPIELEQQTVKILDNSRSFTFTQNIPCRAEIIRTTADLVSGKETHAARLACKIGDLFHISGTKLEHLPETVRNYLESK